MHVLNLFCRKARISFARAHFGFPSLPKDNTDVECEDLIPLVFGGDFNATPHSRVYKFMFPHNKTPDPAPGSSLPSDSDDASNSPHTTSTSGQTPAGAVDPDSGFYFEAAPQNGTLYCFSFSGHFNARCLRHKNLFGVMSAVRLFSPKWLFVGILWCEGREHTVMKPMHSNTTHQHHDGC